MAKITKITPEQSARFKEWVDKWVEIGLSTEQADFDAAERAALKAYDAAKLAMPKVILRVSSPVGAVIGGVWALDVLRQPAESIASLVESQVWSQVGSRVESQVESQVWSQVLSQVLSQVWSQVESQVWSQVGSRVESQVESQVWSQVWSQVESQVWSQVESQVLSQVLSQVWSQVWSQVESQVWSLVGSRVESQMQQGAYRNLYMGSMYASWGAYGSFFRDVMNWDDKVLDLFEIYEALIKSCGLVWWHEDVLVISDRPLYINRDDDGRLHCEDGPAIMYRDGWSIWSVHGVSVNQNVIENPSTITVEAIDNENNAEVRRVMMDRYKFGEEVCGPAAYVRDSKSTIVDHDQRWGTLYRREIKDDEPIVILEVINRTAETDGSFKRYWLRVDPECRPLNQDGTKGEPQRLSAHAAVASTFGMRAEEYCPEFES